MAQERFLPGDVGLLIASWFIPGLGFIAKRNYWRGIAIFLLINVTFLIGLLLHGTVLVPEFRYTSPGFNIVSLLTFLGELGNGGGALLSILHDKYQLNLYRPIEQHPWFDLATLYLLVSGSANYFCVSNFYDRYISSRARAGADSEVEQ